jgi:membrane-associated phospholipid phosphatase
MPDPSTEKSVGKIKDAAQQAAKAETTSPATRWYRTALFRIALFLAIGVFAMLTFLVETTPSFPIDLQITRAIQSIDSPFFEGSMRLISWPGFLPQSIVIPLLIAFILYIYGLHWESVTSLLAATASGLTNELVKDIIRRPRPTIDLVHVFAALKSYSFPSGHVMFYVSFFGFIWYLVFTLLKRSWKRGLLLGFFGGLILLVGVSRIYLGQHWASDVLGAYLLGGLLLAGIILFYQWGKKRFFLHQPVAPHDTKEE